jgi:hypothetical protein
MGREREGRGDSEDDETNPVIILMLFKDDKRVKVAAGRK